MSSYRLTVQSRIVEVICKATRLAPLCTSFASAFYGCLGTVFPDGSLCFARAEVVYKHKFWIGEECLEFRR
jgi:hypothetical protein